MHIFDSICLYDLLRGGVYHISLAACSIEFLISYSSYPNYCCLYRIKDFGQAVVANEIEEEHSISKADVLLHMSTTYFREGKLHPRVRVHRINRTETLSEENPLPKNIGKW